MNIRARHDRVIVHTRGVHDSQEEKKERTS